MTSTDPDFRALPGDVVLFGRKEHDALGAFIARMTGSIYSHSAIALGSGRYSDAWTGGPEGDVAIYDEAFLESLARDRRLDRYRGPGNTAHSFDVVAMELEVARLSWADDPNDRVVFSVGALAAVAALHLLTEYRLPLGHQSRQRLHGALLRALEDGDRRLYCSEYVFRISRAGGYPPALPADPFIPVKTLPPAVALEESGLIDWAVGALGALMTLKCEDPAAFATFDEVWSRVKQAYVARDPGPTTTDRANFYVPSDFAKAYTHVSTWYTGVGWGPPTPVPDPPDA